MKIALRILAVLAIICAALTPLLALVAIWAGDGRFGGSAFVTGITAFVAGAAWVVVEEQS